MLSLGGQTLCMQRGVPFAVGAPWYKGVLRGVAMATPLTCKAPSPLSTLALRVYAFACEGVARLVMCCARIGVGGLARVSAARAVVGLALCLTSCV